MLADDRARKASPKTHGALKKMLDVYLGYKEAKDRYERFGGSDVLIKIEKDQTIVKLRELSQFNENTLAAYDSLFGRLLD
jgi:hypothetical protein